MSTIFATDTFSMLFHFFSPSFKKSARGQLQKISGGGGKVRAQMPSTEKIPVDQQILKTGFGSES